MPGSLVVCCPICGASSRVAMAIGQLLRCPSCQTTFHAPLGEPGETSTPQPSARGTPPRPTGYFPKAAPSSTTTGDSPASRSAASAPVSPAGRDPHLAEIAHWPTREVDPRELSEPLSPASVDSLLPESAASVADAPESARDEVPPAHDVDEEAEPFWLTWLLPIVCVSLTASAVLVALLVFGQRRDVEDDPTNQAGLKMAEKASAAEEPPPQPAPRWSDATQYSQRNDRVSVRVEDVSYGQVVARDRRGGLIRDEGDRYLKIRLKIRNRATEPRVYTSWYGSVFSSPGFTTGRAAALWDDGGEVWRLMMFSDASSVQGHTPQATLEPGQQVDDLLVFEVPEDLDRSKLRYLRLELPSEAIGAPGGAYRFEIPRDMIGDW